MREIRWQRLRTQVVVASVLMFSVLQGMPSLGAAAAGPTCGTTTTVNYTVQICLTAPAAGATVTGNTSVTATASLHHPQVRDMVFTVDGGYLLTDFQNSSPYTFTWPTAQWIDGVHTLGVSALMFDNTTTPAVTESVTLSNGVTTPPVNTNKPTITPGTTPSPGSPLIIGAAGDGAGGEPISDQVVSMVTSWLPNLFLYLGDVYQNGSYTEFVNWYDPSFGTLRGITDPTVGNHEYLLPRAPGYFNYWNNEPNYYSFDSAGWHIISLNSNAGKLGSGGFSNEVTWLNNDLTAHRGSCIIAFWHHPLFNIGREGQTAAIQPLWTALANARGTIVLTGHDHTYQRWQPLDANGNVSASGMTEFVVGTGGHAVLGTTFVRTDSRVAASLAGTAGALQLALSQTSARFRFIGSSGGAVIDSGTVPCQGYGTLTGTVTDAGSGKPISSATVSYTGGSATTDALGHYTLAPVTVGTYSLTAGAPGYGSQSQTVTVGGGATVTQNFGLATPNAGTITGAVRDSVSNQPISGATVAYAGGSATTNGSGVYTLSNVAAGTYSVTASANAYSSQTQTVSVALNATSTQNFSLAPLPASITGAVTDAVTAKAIADATVSYSGGSTTTNAAGVYTLTGVVEGTYAVTASATNYTTSAPVSVTVGPGATATQNVSLAPLPGSISGTVTDSGTGTAIANATVSYSGGSTTANASGVYSLSGVTEGSYSVTASASGYSSQSQTVAVVPGATATQNFSLAPLPGSITGTVTDAVTAKAIANATVSYSGGSASTNASGAYTLSNVAPGTYSVTASANAYSSQTQTVSVALNATSTQNFSLAPLPGSITGTVTDSVTAKPIVNTTVSYSGGSATTNGSGVYTLSGVTEGSYSVTASAANYTSSAPTAVTVGPGATATQNFSLAPMPGSITGTVTDAVTTKPIVGATVSYSGGSTTTDGSGTYTLSGVTEGSYSVTASASGYGSQSQTVSVGPGATVTQAFSLPPGPGSIMGTITDSNTNAPISGATVSYSGGSTTSNGSGVYTLANVAPGSYVLTASAGGYASQQSPVVTVTAGNTATQNLSLAPLPGSITGTVTDAVTANAIAGATVSYSGGSTTTNAAGVYTLTGVVEGSYAVTASATNYTGSAPVSVTVGPGTTATQNVSLAPLAGSISGTVTDAVTAKAIVGATVSYSGGSTTTDGSGAYTLTGVTEGSYSVTASASGYGSLSQSVTVGPGASVSQNFGLTAASTAVFSDGFESGSMSAWTTSTGLTVESTTVHSGTHAAEGNTTAGATYARKTLSTTYTNLYYRTYFDLKSEGANTVSLMGLRTAAAGPLVRLYVDTSGHLGMRNEVAGTSATGPAVSLGSWHSLEVHVIINGTSSTTEAWLDGTAVSAFGNLAANLGTTPVGMLQLGENTTARTYDVVFDDVVAATSRIGP